MDATVTHYRLSWEEPADDLRNMIQQRWGFEIWPVYNWDLLRWQTRRVLFNDDNHLERERRMLQHSNLLMWVRSRQQPVQNVVLERLDDENGAVWTIIT